MDDRRRRAALAVLDDMTRRRCAAYSDAAAAWETRSMAAALPLVRRGSGALSGPAPQRRRMPLNRRDHALGRRTM